MQYINLTGHIIRLMDETGAMTIEILPSGIIARVVSRNRKFIDASDDIKRYRIGSRQIVNLPSPANNTVYIVSKVVLAALNGRRKDVYAPDRLLTENSEIIGAGALVQFEKMKRNILIKY